MTKNLSQYVKFKHHALRQQNNDVTVSDHQVVHSRRASCCFTCYSDQKNCEILWHTFFRKPRRKKLLSNLVFFAKYRQLDYMFLLQKHHSRKHIINHISVKHFTATSNSLFLSGCKLCPHLVNSFSVRLNSAGFLKYGTSSNHHVNTCLGDLANVINFYPSVNFKSAINASFINHFAGQPCFIKGARNEGLSSESRVDTH
mmetsp:Transcript_37144/g.37450  ORF Transcript_37144/g.37450 Transcript_37144/m.37450 type:complete len:200 (+) Transcript_37144:62-661(+)